MGMSNTRTKPKTYKGANPWATTIANTINDTAKMGVNAWFRRDENIMNAKISAQQQEARAQEEAAKQERWAASHGLKKKGLGLREDANARAAELHSGARRIQDLTLQKKQVSLPRAAAELFEKVASIPGISSADKEKIVRDLGIFSPETVQNIGTRGYNSRYYSENIARLGLEGDHLAQIHQATEANIPLDELQGSGAYQNRHQRYELDNARTRLANEQIGGIEERSTKKFLNDLLRTSANHKTQADRLFTEYTRLLSADTDTDQLKVFTNQMLSEMNAQDQDVFQRLPYNQRQSLIRTRVYQKSATESMSAKIYEYIGRHGPESLTDNVLNQFLREINNAYKLEPMDREFQVFLTQVFHNTRARLNTSYQALQAATVPFTQ